MNDVTLQINISPGDINYAHLTVPALVNQHREIKKRLLVVDCCRPQKTNILDPDTRFPLEKFERDAAMITKIALDLHARQIVSDVYFLKPNDPIIDRLSKKYLRGLYKTTHGAGGMVNMGYWVGFDLPDTRYLLHYDGDMMVYQKEGYSWVKDAITHMHDNPEVFMSVPRLCPPLMGAGSDLPSSHEGRPFTSTPYYWKNDWFSTRQFLLDRQKFDTYLPLVQGKVLLELLVRKYGRRAFPLDPEILIQRSVAKRGGKRLILKSADAWIVHPIDKSPGFLDVLPQVLTAIANGEHPVEQRGLENMQLDAWQRYLTNTTLA